MFPSGAQRRIFLTLVGAVLIAGSASTCSRHYLLGINTTDSLPGSVFLVYRDQTPGTDDIIAFRAPKNRFYPNRVFLKLVKGRAGDVLSWRQNTLMINGQPLGVAKAQSRSGEPLEPTPATILGPGQFFTWTPHPDSFDSRYTDIGLIDGDRVIGRAVRLL